MKILLYKGLSWVSKMIQWQTRSKYSHAAIMLPCDMKTFQGAVRPMYSTYEAWHVGGVRVLRHPWQGHRPGTPIDVYDVSGPYNTARVLNYLESRLGIGYDFGTIFRFINRRDDPTDAELICSEYTLTAFYKGGNKLLHMRPSHCAPVHLSWSPKTHYQVTIHSMAELTEYLR